MAGEVRAAAEAIGEYALVCVTSPNGAALLMDALAELGKDARALASATVAAIGPGTAAELARAASAPTWCPSARWPRRWCEALEDVPVQGRRVLVARAAEARDLLPDGAARARRRGGRGGALRDRGGAARREAQLRAAAAPTT